MLSKIEGVRILKTLEDGQHIDSFDIHDLGAASEGTGRFKGIINVNGQQHIVLDNHVGKVASELALKGLQIANGRGTTEVVVVKGGGIFTNDPDLKMVGANPSEGGEYAIRVMETKPLRDLDHEARVAAREVLSA